MKFTKYHGAGNDFVVVDARASELDWGLLAPKLCDRHFGVGADGAILVTPTTGSVPKMRMFNPDGSEAEACGNGLRCFVKFVLDHGLVSADVFDIETLAGARHATAFRDEHGNVNAAEVSMGVPRFEPTEIPAQLPGQKGPVLGLAISAGGHSVSVNLLSMGNPHAVAFLTEDVADYPLSTVGPAMERHDLFPARINFEIARVLGRRDIKARVWERGAGETLACGSGACAVAVAARLLGYCDREVNVHLPGGVLTVTLPEGDEEVLLRGPVEQVFAGDWPDRHQRSSNYAVREEA
jgi:diaminopimelate epimerase